MPALVSCLFGITARSPFVNTFSRSTARGKSFTYMVVCNTVIHNNSTVLLNVNVVLFVGSRDGGSRIISSRVSAQACFLFGTNLCHRVTRVVCTLVVYVVLLAYLVTIDECL